MADEKSFDDIADEAAASLSAALGQLEGAAEPPAAADRKPDAPAGEDDPDKSATPPKPDGQGADGDGDDADTDDDDEDEDDEELDPNALLEQLKAKDEEIERLKAEKAQPAGAPAAGEGKGAEPPASKEEPPADEPKGETYDQMMDRISKAADPSTLNDDDRQVFSRLSTLRTQQKAFEDLKVEKKGAVEKEATLETEAKDLERLLAHAKAELAEDDLDTGNQRRYERYSTELKEKRAEIDRHQTALSRLENKVQREERSLEAEILRFDEDAKDFHGQLQTVRSRTTQTKDLQNVWQKGLAAAFTREENALTARKERKFNDHEREIITLKFQSKLNTFLAEKKSRNENMSSADLEAWLLKETAPFALVHETRKANGAAGAKRAAGLEPRRPTDAKAPRRDGKPGKERTRSFDDEYEASGEKLDRMLKAV